jgi:3-hydroxybutyryl-CoA dehydrogenase
MDCRGRARAGIGRQLGRLVEKGLLAADEHMANALRRPERFIGMHFFSPVPRMKLLELVQGLRTSRETLDTARAVGERLGKVIVLSKDTPGCLVNRVLDVMLNEAVHLLGDGSGSIEDIDTGLKYGCNHPMGPFELIDFAGADILAAVMDVFYGEFKEDKYRPAVLLKRMVSAGMLGKKTGAGFYVYDKDGNRLGPNPELLAYIKTF